MKVSLLVCVLCVFDCCVLSISGNLQYLNKLNSKYTTRPTRDDALIWVRGTSKNGAEKHNFTNHENVTYSDNDLLNYECSFKSPPGAHEVKWIQEKHGKKIFEGYPSQTSTLVIMRLNMFDDDSTLTCSVLDHSSFIKPEYSITIHLSLKEDSWPVAMPGRWESVTIGETVNTSSLLDKKCGNQEIFAVPVNATKTSTYTIQTIPALLHVTTEHDWLLLFCYPISVYNDNKTVDRDIFSMTQITTLTKITNDTENNITDKDRPEILPNETTSSETTVSDTTVTSTTTTPHTSTFTTSQSMTTSAIVGIILILALLIFIIYKFVKRKLNRITENVDGPLRNQATYNVNEPLTGRANCHVNEPQITQASYNVSGPQRNQATSIVNEPLLNQVSQNAVGQQEPVYAAPQVIYADLQLLQDGPNRNINRTEQHYAEIVGVMEPKNNK